MAQSEVNCANAALTRLGEQTITALSDNNVRANACNARIDACKQAMLRLHPWNFALKRDTLELLDVTAAADDGGGEVQLTTSANHGLSTGNKVTVIGVLGTTEANGTWTITKVDDTNISLDDSAFSNTYSSGGHVGLAPDWGYNWAYALPSDCLRVVEVNPDDIDPEFKVEGSYLLTDLNEPYIKYIFDVTDYTAMDSLFYDILASYLAWDICMRVTQSNTLRQQMWEEFRIMLGKARFVDATEDSTIILEANDFVASRFGRNQGYVRDPQT